MTRIAARLAALIGAVVVVSLTIATPVSAFQVPDGDPTGTAVVADSAEAWFTVVPEQLCTSPVGCPPAPPSPFPADTLQIGTSGGLEIHRTYLRPALTALPTGATITGGSLVMPLADQASGTAVVDPPAVSVCLVTEPFTDGVEGDATLPKTDCAVKAAAALSPQGDALVADITVLAAAWAGGTPNLGVALVPVTGTPGATWHLAGNGKDRAGVDPTAKVSWRITYVVVAEGEPPPVIELPPAPEVAPPPVDAFVPPVAPTPTAPVPTPVVTAPRQVRPSRAFVAPWFSHDGIVFVPLALLVGCSLMLRLLTQPVPPLTTSRTQP